MAATDKTGILGLSKWRATDKPKRIDFVNDNEIIDSNLGGHINNADIHITTALSEKINEPVKILTVTGSGGSSRSIVMDFAPSLVFVFAVDKPQTEISGTTVKVYSAIGVQGKAMGGLLVDGDEVRIFQNTIGNTIVSLNESGVTYVVAAIK